MKKTHHWYSRKFEGARKEDRDGKMVCVVTTELVCDDTVFHRLTGPTAAKSIQQFADRLNAENYPPKKIPKRIFGGKPIKNDPNQLTFPPV